MSTGYVILHRRRDMLRYRRAYDCAIDAHTTAGGKAAELCVSYTLWLLNRGPAEGYSAEDTGQSSPERWRSFRTYRADGRAHSSSGSGSKFSSSFIKLSKTHSS